MVSKDLTPQIPRDMKEEYGFINPHFLFNSFGNLYALSLTKSELTPRVVLLLSDFLRYQLIDSKSARVDLDKELKFTHVYIELEKLRIRENISISLVQHGSYDYLKIAPFSLFSMVEAVFLNGPTNYRQPGSMAIEIGMVEALLTIRIIIKPSCLSVEAWNNCMVSLTSILDEHYKGKGKLSLNAITDGIVMTLILDLL